MQKWKVWIYGIISAFIGAFASGVTVVIVAPETFNLDEGMRKLITVCTVMGIVAVANYLKQSPLPREVWTEEQRKERTNS